MHVVATAGHVDHGKSTLVRALTGTDPDRLEEERRRGLSIELGYAWTTLDGVGEVAFVDVPGHQRFLTTTLAGVGPVPVALLVVAADDPWMPQAAEHLAALHALGVTRGVLVVTRADLADPSPALARARDELATTSLASAPWVVVSGRTGRGLDELRATLTRVLAAVPSPDPEADVRLWVDRHFHVRGSGTVVTGTLPAGTIAVGDTLAVHDAVVRVRGVESLGTTRDTVSGVARVALDLGGRAPTGIGRGTALVTPGAFVHTRLVDVRLDVGAGDGRLGGERLPEGPVLHLGSDHCGTHARPLDEQHARLTLEHPLPLRVGDRGILRDPGSRTIWGVRVLDPEPPALTRRGAAAARAAALAAYDGTAAGELRLRGVVTRAGLRRRGVPAAPLPVGSTTVGDHVVGPEHAAALRTRLEERVREQAQRSGTGWEAGIPVVEAARFLGLSEPRLVEALVREPLRLEAGRVVAGPTAPPPELEAALAILRDRLRQNPFDAPGADDLRDLGLTPPASAALHRTGHLLKLADGVVLLPGADDVAREVLARLDQPFSVSQARRALGTSRRVALPLLAHLDTTGRTVRLADDTRRVRGA